MVPARGIRQIDNDKSKYLGLLLLGDESESLIQSYLSRGELFVVEENQQALCLAVTLDDGCNVELKNLATEPKERKKGYASMLIRFLLNHYNRPEGFMFLGTGEVPSTLQFYQQLGFQYWKREKDYFLYHYDHPIIEQGIQLRDRVFLRQKLNLSH